MAVLQKCTSRLLVRSTFLIWLNIVRMLFMFNNKEDVSQDLLSKIGAISWLVMDAMLYTVFFMANQWDCFRQLLGYLCWSEDYFKYAQKRGRIVIVICWIVIFYSIACDIDFIFFSEGGGDILLVRLNSIKSINLVQFRCIYLITVDVFVNVIACLPLSVIFLISLLIAQRFTDLNHRIRQAVWRSPSQWRSVLRRTGTVASGTPIDLSSGETSRPVYVPLQWRCSREWDCGMCGSILHGGSLRPEQPIYRRNEHHLVGNVRFVSNRNGRRRNHRQSGSMYINNSNKSNFTARTVRAGENLLESFGSTTLFHCISSNINTDNFS